MPSSFEIKIRMSLFYETCARLFLAEPFQLGSTIAKEDANHTDTQSEGWRCKTWQKAIDGSTSQSRTSRHLSSTKEPGLKKALKKPTDLVLAAGGDGTTAKVASRLVDSGIPLSVLPLGTANNLARALGFVASPEEIIARLEGGRKQVFDVGLATGPWGGRYFFEGAGGGLLADYVRAAKKEEKKNRKAEKLSKEQQMARHSALLRRMLHDYPARQWKIEIDGKDIAGRYVLWEAMNISSAGPALHLAPRTATK